METKQKKIDKIHKEELGFGLPENYFENSKKEILSSAIEKKQVRKKPFYNKKFVWLAAAGFALLFTLTIYKQQSNSSVTTSPTIVSGVTNVDANLQLADGFFIDEDVLVASLFVSDNELKSFINDSFIEAVSADENLDDYIVDELMSDELY